MNYRQTEGQAQTWRRAYQIHVNNFYGQQPNIVFQEEDVVQVGDMIINRPAMEGVQADFVLGAEIPLVNPDTLELLGTTAKHEDLQVILFSLYMQLVAKRDAPAVVDPNTLPPLPPEQPEQAEQAATPPDDEGI